MCRLVSRGLVDLMPCDVWLGISRLVGLDGLGRISEARSIMLGLMEFGASCADTRAWLDPSLLVLVGSLVRLELRNRESGASIGMSRSAQHGDLIRGHKNGVKRSWMDRRACHRLRF